MIKPARREFIKNMLSSLLTVSLLETLFEQDLFANSIKPVARQWLLEVEQVSKDLKDRKLIQTEWQRKVEELFSRVDLSELLRLIDFERMEKQITYAERGEATKRIKFGQLAGLPEDLTFVRQLFALKKDRAIVPHGHHNMVTMHMIIKGRLQGRHYERLHDEPQHIIIKPSIEKVFNPSDLSTISDNKDNVHWFKAITETAFTFNIGVYNLDPDKDTGRDYLDPNSEKIEGGLIRARRLSAKEAFEIYG